MIPKRLITIFFLLVLSFNPGSNLDAKEEQSVSRIPSLEKTLSIALEHHSKQKADHKAISESEVSASVKKLYYQIQFKLEQLSISREVKEHFEKAITKAEEKFDEGEGDVGQAEITKLKLGLSSIRNDIIQHESDLKIAKLSLGQLMGRVLPSDSNAAEEKMKIRPLPFGFKSFKDYLSNQKGHQKYKPLDGAVIDIHKAFLNVKKLKDKMKLAQGNRKITRALLVAELANYDLGIGEPDDLFEALLIYTRVLSGYYEAVYNFNISVVELDSVTAKS